MDGPHLGPGRRRGDVVLRVEEPPGSLEMQLLFQRAGVYLALACQHAKSLLSYRTSVAVGAAGQRGEGSDVNATATNHGDGAVPSPAEHGDAASENNNNSNKPDPGLSLGPEQQATAPAAVAQARKWVRTHAKRALRDYLSFLSHLEYSPDFPTHLAEQFIETLKRLATRARSSGSYPPPSRPDGPVSPLPVTHRTFAVSDLFAANPPSDLPPYPKTDVVSSATVTTTTNGPRQSAARPAAAEILTYHPLLTDALHSVLLCHCLLHTSPAELLRHARMVARLTRLADGYPVFQGSRPPARADWIAVLRALPHRDHQRLLLRQGEGNDAGKNDDDDVGDSDTWTSQFVAAWEEALGVQPPLPLFRGGPQPKTEGDGSGGPEHPVGTERATVVARWLLEVPPPEDGAGRRRKKKVVSGVSALAFGGGGGGGGGGWAWR
ncbi:hypothetical protein VTK73DRAFT_5468 [Phialemonium thermophilum]|uniref:Uncharacterized protein n=1 Tax=Phialemonium thermophilum TaxID=223376 RepID=A0ABR3V1N9_9PEZI